MKLGFEEAPQAAYDSECQNARVLTEQWAASQGFCPHCGNMALTRFNNNRPVADLFCSLCLEEYELKSQRHRFGRKIVDGAYAAMCQRLRDSNNPNLMLMNYHPKLGVKNLIVVPKQFFVEGVIERRNPLSITAKRAGWVGCNILFSLIPDAGKIYVVRDSTVLDREAVLNQWQKTLFLRRESDAARGWLLNVLWCVERLQKTEFTLEEVYAFEGHLSALYPSNNHVRQKIRQQLQVLRDAGFISFLGKGHYQLEAIATT